MSLPLLTRDIAPSGGVFKASPEDFEVEELPAYLPNGEAGAEHLFVWLQKRDRTTQEVAKALARHAGVPEKAISWAGLKDRNAVTRQFLCGPAKALEPVLSTFAMDGVTVLSSARHRNKLKTGHLRGNRFRVVVREVDDARAARESLGVLTRDGLPNFFGEQRFGRAGDNAERGKQLLQAGGRHRDRFERKLLLSAFQSKLFNRVLALRLEAGTFTRALMGDVLKKHETGGEFVCADAALDSERVARFEVSPTGPLYGPQMRRPGGEVEALEQRVLEEEGATAELFERGGDETQGARRLMRVPLELESVEGERTLTLTFTLPAGSYATEVLREVLKPTASD